MNHKPELIQRPKISDPRGNLSFIEENSVIPFSIRRVYWIYDVPGGEIRGAHAFKEAEELIIALSGSFSVSLNDGKKEQVFHLNRSYIGLLVPKMYWRTLFDFSTNSVALILSSTRFDSGDYIRDFNEFLKQYHYD